MDSQKGEHSAFDTSKWTQDKCWKVLRAITLSFWPTVVTEPRFGWPWKYLAHGERNSQLCRWVCQCSCLNIDTAASYFSLEWGWGCHEEYTLPRRCDQIPRLATSQSWIRTARGYKEQATILQEAARVSALWGATRALQWLHQWLHLWIQGEVDEKWEAALLQELEEDCEFDSQIWICRLVFLRCPCSYLWPREW